MNPKLRKIGLIAVIIAILIVLAFLYWVLCIPPPARVYQEITPRRCLLVHSNSVLTENRDKINVEFVFNCGAARLKPTEWKEDFPAVKWFNLGSIEVKL
jgi:hypothetical protein